MPIGYLSRISHTFIYELSSFCTGKASDWIVRSQFSSLTVYFHISLPQVFFPLVIELSLSEQSGPSVILSGLLGMGQGAYRSCLLCLFAWKGLCVPLCVYIQSYVCCECPAVHFT